jgi:hypothetical protein
MTTYKDIEKQLKYTHKYVYIYSLPHPTRMLTSSCHDPGKSTCHQILQKEAKGIIGEVWPTGCQPLLLLPATREENGPKELRSGVTGAQ